MNWFYSLKGRQTGPVDTAELTRLAATGEVQPNTLVWREGMADWEPYSRVEMTQLGARGGTACSECRQLFPNDELVVLAGGPTCAACKPLVLERLREGVSHIEGAANTRKQHLSHEASIRSVGTLYLFGGWVVAGLTVLMLGLMQTASRGPGVGLLEIASMVLLAGLGVVQIWTGRLLRRLDAGARIPTTILSCIGLLGFPIGTLINGYILYLIHSAKGRFILSPQYQGIVAATPEIKYRTSIVVWIVLGLIVAALVFAVFAGMRG